MSTLKIMNQNPQSLQNGHNSAILTPQNSQVQDGNGNIISSGMNNVAVNNININNLNLSSSTVPLEQTTDESTIINNNLRDLLSTDPFPIKQLDTLISSLNTSTNPTERSIAQKI